MASTSTSTSSSHSSVHWTRRLFGENLIKSIENNPSLITPECFNYLGVYFSFANINAQKETSRLLHLYERLNHGGKKHLAVVQVVLWANNDVFGNFEVSHQECVVDKPWFVVPFEETQLKMKLSRKFRIKTGVPTLIILDENGSIVTVSGQERLSDDPEGELFPWKPRPLQEVLRDVNEIYQDLPKNSIKALYFSANWCPPCRAFTPQLITTYNYVRKKDENFEIIFISSDRSEESYNSYVGQMPWLAVPYNLGPIRKELADIYGVRGIPTIILLDENDQVILEDARLEIQQDPEARNYPWRPRLINELNERYSGRLHDGPAVILFPPEPPEDAEMNAVELLKPSAIKYHDELLFLIGSDSETSDSIKDLLVDDCQLIILDLPNNCYASCSTEEITQKTVLEFVDKYTKHQLVFKQI